MLQIVTSSGTDDKALVFGLAYYSTKILRMLPEIQISIRAFCPWYIYNTDRNGNSGRFETTTARTRNCFLRQKTCEPSQKDQIGLYSFVFETLWGY